MIESRGLLLVMMGMAPKDEADFNRWYEEEHIPERLAIPGFHRARRYRAVHGEPKYLALYDVESPAIFKSDEYLKFYAGAGQTAWTRRVEAAATAYTRNIYEKISEKTAGDK